MGQRGATILELLVATAMAGIVAAAGYSFYDHTFKFQTYHERQKEMQARLQISMDILARELRHAGYGIISPLPLGNGLEKGRDLCAGVLDGIRLTNTALCNVVGPKDGGPDGTDSLSIMQVGDELVGTLSAPTNTTTKEITLNKIGTIDNTLGLVSLGGFFTAQVVSISGTSTLNLNMNPDNVYPIGFPVYSLLKVGGALPTSVVTYAIGTSTQEKESFLSRNGALFVSGIEDMQVAYLLTEGASLENGGAWALNDPVKGTPIPTTKSSYLAIRLSLIAYAKDPNPNFKGGQRPALENHLAGAADKLDSYRRVVLTRVVELKNDGCDPKDLLC